MTYPKVNSISDVFLPDGYGAFGYGAGQYGGYSDLLSPQWNTNSGTYYLDPLTSLPAVQATSVPSFVGAALYDATYSSFFAKIVPATSTAGGLQTALVIKHDANNFVEMSFGPNGIFTAYVSNNNEIAYTASPVPAYDPVAHAYWRIRNDDALLFHFDVSPDALTWTELGSVPYYWDATVTTVVFLAGFTSLGQEGGNVALISSVNLAPGLTLSATTRNSASVIGNITATSALVLSGSVNAIAGLRADFNATLGIPRGGLTDYGHTGPGATQFDSLQSLFMGTVEKTYAGATTFTNSNWSMQSIMATTPTYYRDGSYWPVAQYFSPYFYNFNYNTAYAGNFLLTGVGASAVTGSGNRLSVNSSMYTETCAYTGNQPGNAYLRSTDYALAGQYSGKLTYGPSNQTIGTGQTAYWILPTRASMVPVRTGANPITVVEGFVGTVYLNTARANTNWFASLVYYDASWNIMTTGTTYKQATVTNMNVHPGGNVWQQGNVQLGVSPVGAKYVSVIPVVIAPSPQVKESVYVSGHYLYSTLSGVTDLPNQVAYENPQQSDIVVKADRVNYVSNPNFANGHFQYWTTLFQATSGTPSPLTLSYDGSVGRNIPGSIKSAVVPISGSFAGGAGARLGPGSYSAYQSGVQPVVEGLIPGNTYTISAYVLQGPGCPDVYMKFTDSNFVGTDYISTNQAASNGFQEQGGWVRVSTVLTVPPTATPTFQFWFSILVADIPSHAPFNFWIDDLLVEEGSQLLPYFDGSFGSNDYQWETGYSTGTQFARSHYYNGYANKLVRIQKALPSVLPVGESYSLSFAQPPSYP